MDHDKNARRKGAFGLDGTMKGRQFVLVNQEIFLAGRPDPIQAIALALLLSAPAAPAQVVPLIWPVESRSHISAGQDISLPFVIENPNERRVECGIFFNFKDRPIWEGAAKLDPLERLRHTAKIQQRHFVFDARPVRARVSASVETEIERQSTPMEIVFTPLLPLQPQCRFRIRGQHRINGPAHRSDLLADVSIHADGRGLRSRLVLGAAPPEATWEMLMQPLGSRDPVPDATHFVIRRGPRGPVIESSGGPAPDARLESPPEAGDGRVLDVIFSPDSEHAISLQVILWLAEGENKEAYCAFAGTLDQARDPAYAPEFVPRIAGATHRAWVRPVSP